MIKEYQPTALAENAYRFARASRPHIEQREVIRERMPSYEIVRSERQNPGTVIILAPHYDDDGEFSGGLTQWLSRNGVHSVYAAFTDGGEGTGPYTDLLHISQQDLIRKRQEEFQAAISVLDDNRGLIRVDNTIPVVPDMQLAANYTRVCETIESLVKKYKPGFIVGPNRKDYHPDHNALGLAMLDVAKALDVTAISHDKQFGYNYELDQNAYNTGDSFIIPEDTAAYFQSVKQGSVYESSIAVQVPPSMMWRKLRAIMEYESQMYGQDFPQRIALSNARRGKWINTDWAEVFDIAHQSKNGMQHPLSSSLPDGIVHRKISGSDGWIIPERDREMA